MLSRRKSKTLVSLLAIAAVGTLAVSSVSATTTPPDTEPAATDAAGTEPAATEAAGTEAAAGSAAVGEVGGSGCGIPHGPYEDPGAAAGEVRVSWNEGPYSFNNATTHAGALANTIPLYLMNSGFTYYDSEMQLVNDDAFGTCTVVSLDPLTVTYTINPGVTWSDGVQVDAADLILSWGAQSTVFNDGDTVNDAVTGATLEADENGQPIIVGPDGEITSVDEEAYAAAVDPETGELLEGYTYKESAGVSFDSSSPSFQLITNMPEISDDGLSVTATWDSFYVDYQVFGLSVGVPAHVVAQRALGIEDATEAKAALIEAFASDDGAALAPIANTWNTLFDQTSLPEDAGIYIGNGAYNVTAFDDTGLTFEAREDYTWGPRPHVQTIVYTVINDPVAAVQAMENEEVDIIEPQATPDVLTQLNALADRGIEVHTGDGATYEHVDMAQNNGGPFDPATYGGDADKARMVRQAFLMTIPRQEIVDRLIKPLNPNAEIRNSLTQVPGSPGYADIVATNGMNAFDTVDIDGAKALLAEAGVTTPLDVRFMYASTNPRRVTEYELIRDSAAQAGFNVIDGGNPNWSAEITNTSIYDAILFGWISTSIDVAGTEANFVTDGANNFYGYSSEVVDGLYEQLKGEADPATQQTLLQQIEAELVKDGFGLSIFQFPEVMAFNSTYVSGVRTIPISPQFFHAFWEWQAA